MQLQMFYYILKLNKKEEKMTKSYKTVEGMFEAIESRRKKYRKKHPVLDRLQTLWYRTKDIPRDIVRKIIRGIQRGYNGWANEDTWGLCNYLSTVIHQSVHHLKENIHGMPLDLTEGQWIDILNEITYAFELTKRISNDDLYLIRDPKKREKWQKTLDELNKKYKENCRCMTPKEIRAYEKGWKLFKKYFFNLWD
jgi:hypothetical protein